MCQSAHVDFRAQGSDAAPLNFGVVTPMIEKHAILVASGLILALASPSFAQMAHKHRIDGKEAVASTGFSLDDDGCGGPSNLEDVQCIGAYIKDLDAELNRVYQKALAAMPELDDTDTRKTREQLRKFERAWLIFKEEDCTLIGGLTGGSNLWVTHFALDCEEKRLRERIRFLRNISEGKDVS